MSKRDTHKPVIGKIVRFLRNKKVRNVKSIEVKRKNREFDYILIGTCMTDNHINSVVDELMELLEKNKVNIIGIEHNGTGGWSVIDVSFAFIHLMLEEKRKFYAIERLYKYL